MPAVLFDAVGTLLRPYPGVAEAYHRAAMQFGSKLTIETIELRFSNAWLRQEELDVRLGDRTSEARERQRWQAIVAETLDDVQESARLFDALWDHFAQRQNWQLDDDVTTVWQSLHAAGLTVGVASNFDQRLQRLCREIEPLGSAAHVFVSSSLTSRKPSRNFFRAIEAVLQLPPDEILLVGDDAQNDYHAARAAGWHAVLLDPTGRRDVEQRVTRLAELPVWIERLLGAKL